MGANSKQIAGSHYARAGSLQHWDMVHRMLDNRYFEGIITKYPTRHRFKNGVQDLMKSVHCTEKLMELHDAGYVMPMGWSTRMNITEQHFKAPEFKFVEAKAAYVGFDMQAYYEANSMNALEVELTKRVVSWRTYRDLDAIKQTLLTMIAEFSGAGSAYVNQD